jgi:hypothetical protein
MIYVQCGIRLLSKNGLGDESVNLQSKRKTPSAIESWAQPGTFAPVFCAQW